MPPTPPSPSRLDRAHEHARTLAGQPRRPAGVPARRRGRRRRCPGPRPPRGSDPGRGRGRPAGDRVRAGSDGDAVRPLLRLRDRRLAAGGAGRRLAGQRLGPERRAAQGHARASAAVEEAGRAPGSSTCSGCRPAAGSASSPARPWPTSPGSRPARDTLLPQAGLGPRRAGSPARRRSGCSPGGSGTPRSTSRCATSGCRRAELGRRRRRRGGSGRTRWPTRLGGGARAADDRAAAGRQPPLRRVRPVRGVHRGSRTSTARGCTSTARSGSGRRRRPSYRHLTAGIEPAPTRGRPMRTRR